MDPGEEEQENEEKMEFSLGVLSQLEALERRERGRAVLREQRERRRERSQILRARIRELRHQRDGLRDKLETLAQDASGIPWDPRQVLLWRLRQLRELLKLFPLTGISGKLSRQGLSLCVHTSFQGSLLGSFPLELQPGRELRGLRLGRHGLPAWLPLHGLAREFLPANPRGLLAQLWGLLSARTARSRQLSLLQEEFPDCIQGLPSSNSLCNLLSLRCRIPQKNPEIPGENSHISGKNPQNSQISGENPQNSQISGEFPGNVLEFRARLRYGDALRSLPTDVEISMEGFPEAPESLALLFRSRSLPRALRALRDGDSQKILELPTGTG